MKFEEWLALFCIVWAWVTPNNAAYVMTQLVHHGLLLDLQNSRHSFFISHSLSHKQSLPSLIFLYAHSFLHYRQRDLKQQQQQR